MEILKVEKLNKIYRKGDNKVEALKNINLFIKYIDFVALA
jgi:putative ABC transport system ATP-binding protein